MFVKIVFKDFCENLTALTQINIYKELKRLGWIESPYFKKELSKTAHVDHDGILKEFNLSQETKIESQLMKL